MTDGQQLLAEYAASGSETAFRELVAGYVDLVYSAAFRLVNADSHRAEDVTQTVFADLARKAGTLSREVMLGGWLHRHTVFVASKTMRGERRRQLRERQAVEMSAIEDHSAENLAQVALVLDEAINELGAEDRAAIMLRFFEQKDFHSVGEVLGNSEEAARKRVDRALEKLEVVLKRRGVALSAVALGTTLATSAVTAAPVGLAATISGVALAGAASGGTALTLLKIMTITKAKAAIIGVILAAAVATPFVIQHEKQTAKLREENETLRKQAKVAEDLATENQRLEKIAAEAAAAARSPKTTNDSARELLRLRGEVGKLRQEKTDIAASKTNGASMLSELRKNPDMWKTIREQQKAGMGMIYGELAKKLKLSKEDGEKLNDTLADHIMNNIDRVTEVLAENKTGAEFEAAFASEESALSAKVKELLGAEGATSYEDYTHHLTSAITAEQFKEKMTGDKAAKEAKAKQLRDIIDEETAATLTSYNLPADFQTLPILNFRNMASEAEGEKNLKLLDYIYARTSARAGTFLSPAEVKNFTEFRNLALNNNRMMLMMNRKMMAPGAK